jgi:nucleoside-diphosphate-sugar epimerase
MGMAARVISFLMPRVSARLYKSLEIDDSAIFNALGWRAPFSTEEGLSKTISYMKRDLVD